VVIGVKTAKKQIFLACGAIQVIMGMKLKLQSIITFEDGKNYVYNIIDWFFMIFKRFLLTFR